MDRIKESAFIITQLNRYSNQEITDYEFIKFVCLYFDEIKDSKLNEFDFKFLKYISDKSGIPMYFDMLRYFSNDLFFTNIDLQTLSSFIYESTLYTSDNISIHKYQKQVLDLFKNKENRYLLTASTSFGKTFLVYEIIRKMKYKNIMLIFPSIALLSENIEKIMTDKRYISIKQKYKIFTLSEIDDLADNNLFIYTPERYLSFLDKNNIKFDFIFIDEIYKLDNEFELDDEIKENERDIAYRLASLFAANINCDLLFAGPYLNIQNNSFYTFLKEKKIEYLDYNKYEIINKNLFTKEKNKYISSNSTYYVELDEETNKKETLIKIIKILLEKNENMIVYSAHRGKNYGTEYYADLISKDIGYIAKKEELNGFLLHLEHVFSDNWIVYKALKKGIGIHHGLVPKYIQKEIINLFNNGTIPILISTTTITEGVNTSAKNLIVLQDKKGNKPLLSFDAKNIAGRSGRLGFHYSGNVFDLTANFSKILKEDDKPLKHKNFEKNVDKDDIDITYTENTYLSDCDKIKLHAINKEREERKIPIDIISRFKMISWNNKIVLFDAIKKLSPTEKNYLEVFIDKNHRNYKHIEHLGFQIILDIIQPIIANKNLLGMIEKKDKNNEYSIICYYIDTYLKDGLQGLIRYQCQAQRTYDKAMAIATKFVFNTLKYQVVKYLGAFNLMYKYLKSIEQETDFDNVPGIDRLLRYFEYNALTDIGRKISDYGVPMKVISYYEETEEKNRFQILNSFDVYERNIYEKTKNIF